MISKTRILEMADCFRLDNEKNGGLVVFNIRSFYPEIYGWDEQVSEEVPWRPGSVAVTEGRSFLIAVGNYPGGKRRWFALENESCDLRVLVAILDLRFSWWLSARCFDNALSAQTLRGKIRLLLESDNLKSNVSDYLIFITGHCLNNKDLDGLAWLNQQLRSLPTIPSACELFPEFFKVDFATEKQLIEAGYVHA